MRGADPDISRLTDSLSPRKYRRVIQRGAEAQTSALGIQPPERHRLQKNTATYDFAWAPKELPFGLAISDAELLNTRAGLVVLTVRQRATGFTLSTNSGLSEPSDYRPELWIHMIGQKDPSIEEELAARVFDTYRVRCRDFYPYCQRFDQLCQILAPISRADLSTVSARALDTLANRNVRQALIDLNRSGTMPISKFEPQLTESGWTTRTLTNAGLVERNATEEPVTVSPTQATRNLLAGNTWHSLLIGHVLSSRGVPRHAFTFERTLSGHEIDVLANIHGRLALVEAKDGRFEVGHAYSVVTKAQMVKPDLVIVVASDGFDSAAKATLNPSAIAPRNDLSDVVLGYGRPREPIVHFVSGSNPTLELNRVLDEESRAMAETAVQDALDAGTLEAANALRKP